MADPIDGYTPSSTTAERPMVTQPKQRLTPDEYLALEREAESKHEYVDGVVVAMTGTTRAESLITANVVGEIGRQLKDRPSLVFIRDLRVRVTETGMHAYPDVVVVRDEPEFGDDQPDTLLNPTLVLEVVSPSTEALDRGRKFAHFRQRASLREYVLVAQDRVSVERYSRQGELWMFTEATSLDEVVELPSIGCTLALRDVYDKVEGLAVDG
jgi:Uma2 family endonuclease